MGRLKRRALLEKWNLTEDEDEEDWPGAGGRLQAPTRGQYTLGVGAAVAAVHDPSTHGLPNS